MNIAGRYEDSTRSLARVTDPTSIWVSKRIRDARTELGWTQADLAGHLGRTQTAVSYWEAAKRKLDLGDVVDLARVLGREVEFFLPPASVRQPVAAVLRAELQRLGSEQLEEAIEAVLSDSAGQPVPAVRYRVGARVPANAANELLEAGAIAAPPVPVEHLLDGCGVTLHRKALPDALSGLLVEMGEGALIAVNDGHVQERQRFTLSHELGHHVLGHATRFHLRFSEAPPVQDYRTERAANEFAAELLMPRRMVAEAVRSCTSTAALAASFEVSEIAMGYRLVNLGLR